MIKKILVSQPPTATAKSIYLDIAKKYGVEIDFRPFIHVERVSVREFRDQRVSILDYSAIVFNSLQAIDHFFSLCQDLRVAMPEDMKYFFLSEKIALYIQKYVQYRKRKIFFAKSGQWDELLELMVKHKKESYFVPQNEVHSTNIATMLDQKGLTHKECTMFRTVSTIFDKSIPFDYDMLIFFTPSGIKSLKENFPDYQQGDVKFGCFGEAVSKTIAENGFRLDLKAPSAEAHSMTDALNLYLEKIQNT